MTDFKLLLCVMTGIIILSISAVVLGHQLPAPTYRCSVCHSENISAAYYQKRGFLSQQQCFYCYNCQKEYNIALREKR